MQRPSLRSIRRDPGTTVELEQALDLACTGDIWIFRGHSRFDRAIQTVTNAPVNHVAMVVALDDLPPLLWHAELGKALPDVWAGKHQRGVQLHDMRAAVEQWTGRYGQRGWFRQLTPDVTRDQEDALLRTIARWTARPSPAPPRWPGDGCAAAPGACRSPGRP